MTFYPLVRPVWASTQTVPFQVVINTTSIHIEASHEVLATTMYGRHIAPRISDNAISEFL